MNETRRKPTTGRQSPTLFDKWHGIFYMPSRIDEAGHTKAFDDPVAEHWGENQRAKRSLVGHTYESEIQEEKRKQNSKQKIKIPPLIQSVLCAWPGNWGGRTQEGIWAKWVACDQCDAWIHLYCIPPRFRMNSIGEYMREVF